MMRGLDAEAYDRQYSDRVILRRIGVYFGPHSASSSSLLATLVMAALALHCLIISTGINIVADPARTGCSGCSWRSSLSSAYASLANWVP